MASRGSPKQPLLRVWDLSSDSPPGAAEYTAMVLLEHGAVKVRRLELAAGAQVPPCPMRENVVFIVLAGQVAFCVQEKEEGVVASPGAAFISGEAQTRSLRAVTDSLILAVLCGTEADTESPTGGSPG